MQDRTIELIDYSGYPMVLGLLTMLGSPVTFGHLIFNIPMMVVGVMLGGTLFMLGILLLTIDPMLVRTENAVKIEWQWLTERSNNNAGPNLLDG